jgi:hypothetical protein
MGSRSADIQRGGDLEAVREVVRETGWRFVGRILMPAYFSLFSPYVK